VLLQQDDSDPEPEKSLRKMANGTTPVHAFSAKRKINLDAILSE
jgi:hypothetical protein